MRASTVSNAPWISPSAPIFMAGWAGPSCPSCLLGGGRHQQVLFVPDEVGFLVHRQLVVLAHEDRADRARLFAVAAEDAARLVNLIDRRVARARLDGAVVLGGLEVDGVGRARDRAEAAGDALLEPV